RSRGPCDPAPRSRRERQRRRDLPGPAAPSRGMTAGALSEPAEAAAAAAVDPAGLREDLATLVRIRSITGDEEAVAADVATRLRQAGIGVEAVALVPGEEDGGQGTLAAIRAGVTGDLAIITEPSNLDIVVAHAGAITFRLTVPGRAAHASRRREGVSALDNLYAVLRALQADEAARNAAETDPLMTAPGLPYPTIVGIVAGGEWASTVLNRVV